MLSEAVKALPRGRLEELVEIYCKDWLAMDGVWFQSIEKKFGMEEAMEHDVAAWSRFTVIEAQKIKKFLSLPDRAGLDGLEQALRLRLYANINDDEILREGNRLVYRTLDCRVQSARSRKNMPWHPCLEVGIVEYGAFARTIDDRITCRALSCYPQRTDETCACSWEFIFHED